MQPFISYIRKWFLLGILILIFLIFYYLHLYEYLSFDAIKSSQLAIKAWTNTHYATAVSLYLLIFIVLIASTIPGATLLTILAGYLFGMIGTVYAIAGTTLGGLVLFYAVRLAFGELLKHHPPNWLKSIANGFKDDAFSYILTLRLFPIFPCWISNIASGALDVPVKTFLMATIIGITPASIIYVMAGRGLEEFFTLNQRPSLGALMTPSLIFPLVALAILSVIPVFYKRIKKRFG